MTAPAPQGFRLLRYDGAAWRAILLSSVDLWGFSTRCMTKHGLILQPPM